MEGSKPEINVQKFEEEHNGLGQDLNVADDEFYVDPVKEVKLLAKLDLAFTPVIMLVYLSCFLDRSNIGKSDILINKKHITKSKI
jgi:hypothetical protein